MRRRLLSLLVVAAALGAAACGDDGASGQTLDATFERLDGGTGDFGDYRGQPVVVNFFSSTCVPCLTEMPDFEEVHQALGDEVAFVGMNVQDTVESGRAIVATTEVTWDIGRDPKGELMTELGSVVLPTTVLLDAEGRVVLVHSGPFDGDELEAALRDKGLTA